jgi:hypothetical protein
MLVVDLLHEFEIGVWKSIFIHLIRILVSEGGDSIAELNKRYVVDHFPEEMTLIITTDIGRSQHSGEKLFGGLIIMYLP